MIGSVLLGLPAALAGRPDRALLRRRPWGRPLAGTVNVAIAGALGALVLDVAGVSTRAQAATPPRPAALPVTRSSAPASRSRGPTLGLGLAVSYTGSAALAAIAEKPEVLGRALVIVGLAEGIATTA